MTRPKLSPILFFAILIIISVFGFFQSANAANINFTLGVWVKPSTSIASKAVLVKNNELRLVTDASGKVACQIHNGAAWQTAAVSASALSLNVWQYLTCSYDGANLKVFIGGEQDGVQAMTENVQNTTNPLYAGRDAGGTYGYFQGIVDDLRIYNYARTQDEILADYNAGKAAHLGKNNQRDDGLVGYWNMEEGTGQTVYDRSGNSNNGTLGASTSVAKDDPVFTSGYSSSGPGGTGLKFDGVNDYVNAGNGASLNMQTAFTWESWIKFNNLSGHQYIYSKHLQYYLFKHDNGALYGYFWGLTDGNFGYTPNFSANTWYHLAVTYNGSYIKIYIDGIEKKSEADSGTISTGSNISLGIGDYVTTTTYPFNGAIDEVRIYNRVLSADEIRQHYNQKKPVLEMKFDEGSGQKAYDESFNNNDGWLGGTSAVEASDPTWVSGKYGSALSFDGTDDYVTATVGQVNTAAGGYNTVEFWMNWGGNLEDTVFDFGNYYDFLIYTSDCIGFNTGQNDTYGFSGLPQNTWVHIAAIFYNGVYTGNSKIYLNGQQQTLSQCRGSEKSGTASSTIYLSKLGTSTCCYFKGSIDSVRIYNYARTQDEILADYNDGKAAHLGKNNQRDDGLVGYWNMEEGKGQTVYDRSGNSNNGTLGASTSVAKDDPVFTSGYSSSGPGGTGLKFDGADDYVDCGQNIFSGQIGTIEVWIKPSILTGEHAFWSYADASSDTDYMMFYTNSNKIRFFWRRGSTQPVIEADTVLSINYWHHAVITSDGSIYKIYINGSEANLTVLAGTNSGNWFDDLFPSTYDADS